MEAEGVGHWKVEHRGGGRMGCGMEEGGRMACGMGWAIGRWSMEGEDHSNSYDLSTAVTVQLHQQQPSQSTTGERKLRFQEVSGPTHHLSTSRPPCIPTALHLSMQHLRNTSARRSEPSPLDIARGNLTKSLRAIFAQHLRAPHNLPLHEAFYFDHVSSLELQLAPHPRKAIQSALSNPAGYLAGANAGGYPHKTISANMPDICIVYQLHLEYGKFINLYDWLQVGVAIKRVHHCPNEKAGISWFIKGFSVLISLLFVRCC